MKNSYELISFDGQIFGLYSPTGFTSKEMKKATKKGLFHYKAEKDASGKSLCNIDEDVFQSNLITNESLFMWESSDVSDVTMTLKEFIDEYAIVKHDDTLICICIKDGEYATHDIANDEGNDLMEDLQEIIKDKMGVEPELMVYDQKVRKKHSSLRHLYATKDFHMTHLEHLLSKVKFFPDDGGKHCVSDEQSVANLSDTRKHCATFKFEIDANLNVEEVKGLTTMFHNICRGNSDYVNNNIVIHSTVFDPISAQNEIHPETKVYMDQTNIKDIGSLMRIRTAFMSMMNYFTGITNNKDMCRYSDSPIKFGESEPEKKNDK